MARAGGLGRLKRQVTIRLDDSSLASEVARGSRSSRLDGMSNPTYRSAVTAADKPLVWCSGEVRSPPFSAQARLEAGYLLRRLQRGESLGMPHSRPMPAVGRRCHELRIPDADATWRILYRVDPDAILILEVFSKKTSKTPRRVLDACRRRINSYDDLR